MIGTWRWNAALGAGGALLTILISLGSNLFLTSLIRGVYAFAVFFLITYVIRWLIPTFLLPKAAPIAHEAADDQAGAVLDMITPPEEDALTELMKESWSEGKSKAPDPDGTMAEFQPLQPKKLVTLDHPDPDQVVEAIRRLTDER
jgi:hypothetical protein